jgi:hypothetical protein
MMVGTNEIGFEYKEGGIRLCGGLIFNAYLNTIIHYIEIEASDKQ